MELLDHNRLQGYRQWRLAHMFLSFIGHGYVWQEGDNDPPKVQIQIQIQIRTCRAQLTNCPGSPSC